ncbi:MAG: radical SAM family heme chaperone HemW [Anaerolineaceae bacterium]|nr:radical SAM family heme chaperone HemW [Anaerolineaceae bacterium]
MNTSLYIHIPFCKHRCHYCDFITTAGRERELPGYADALSKELRIANNYAPKITLHSIYFGGGTPSLVPIESFETILAAIRESYSLTQDCEISLEANPGTINAEYLHGLRSLGFNRLSLGVQSTDSFDLKRLDRIHNIQDVITSVTDARRAGFDNINLDLIFGLPWQDLESWRNSLQRAIYLSPEHFSLYSLIIEEGTALYRWHQKGLIEPQDQDLQADMYELAMDMLRSAGYAHYEISNWAKLDAKRDYRCRHNLQYWLNDPYIGAGAGAQGYFENQRLVNTPRLADYIFRMQSSEGSNFLFPDTPAIISSEFVDFDTRMNDEMMLGLRLLDQGVNAKEFFMRYGVPLEDKFSAEIERFMDLGLLEWVGSGDIKRIRLTHHGVMVANQVFMAFV